MKTAGLRWPHHRRRRPSPRRDRQGAGPLLRAGTLTRPGVAEELANETVAKALHYFGKNFLRTRKWDPARGASIKTYFVGQCLIHFANVYRYWLKHEASDDAVLVDDLALVDRPLPRSPRTDPAVIREEIDTRFTHAPARTRTRLVM